MIGIFILIGVIRNYWKLAKARGKNAYLWAFLSFIIYYGSMLLMAIAIMFFLGDYIEEDTAAEFLFNLIIGVLSLLLTYLLAPILIKDDKILSLEEQDDILDASL